MMSNEVDFVKYVSLLKTIRGVILSKQILNEQIKKWIRRSIRWRPVGASINMIETLKKSGFSSKLIKNIVFPFDSHREIAAIIAENVDLTIAETIVLSSLYIVPILILDNETLRDLQKKNIVIYEIHTDKKLSDKDIKLHMRIAEYSMKDYHFDVIESAEKAIISGEIDSELKRRKKLCMKDAKRYWRIRKESGDTIIVYLDPLRLLLDKIHVVRSLVEKDKKIKMCFGLPVGLAIPNMLRK